MYVITLNTIKRVKDFSNEVLRIDSEATVRSHNGKYAVDAKSIMGIFSLDLTQLLLLEIDGEENEFVEKIKDMGVLIQELKDEDVINHTLEDLIADEIRKRETN